MSWAKLTGAIVLYGIVESSRQNAEWNLPCFVSTNTCVYKCTYLYYNTLYACTFRIKYAQGPRGNGLKMCFFEKFFFCKVLYFFFLKYFKLVKHHCLSRRWLASDWDWAEAAPRMVQISVPKCQAASHSVRDARGSLSRSWCFHSLIVWEVFPKLLFSTRDFLIWDTFRWGCLWCTWPGQSKGERALPQLSQ